MSPRRSLQISCRIVRLALVSLAISATSASAQIDRGPYLQQGTDDSMVIVYRTSRAVSGGVCYGTAPGSLGQRVTGPSTTSHAIPIGGLTPGTRYYYAADRGSCTATTSGSSQDYFVTAPASGTAAPFRFWVVGDSGTGSTRQGEVRDAMLDAAGSWRPDIFLHVGDMAYTDGTTSEFDSRFFAPYHGVLRNTVCWPALGNHEGHSSDSGTQSGPYYEAYVLPTNGEAGGLASGTEAYYSFDYANVHFVILDSHDSPRGVNGAMLRWLEMDLASTDQRWIVASWHHPPYTKGSHDSDTETALIEMRENALPMLEAAGVDMVFGGHSHIYERSHLVHGAYDTPTTSAGHFVDRGDGRVDGDGAYIKENEGTVYVVAGHGGTSLRGDGDHPLMYFSELEHGSLLVDVDGDSLTLRNIRWDGVESDHLTMIKRGGPPVVVDPVEEIEVIVTGSVWEYDDRGIDLGDSWRTEVGGWPTGPAQLGYGDGDEATLVRDQNPNAPTVYFRRSFIVDGRVDAAHLRTLFDDGVAVWINGQLVYAANVDAGLDYADFASGTSPDNRVESVLLDLVLADPFVIGENIIAVAVKQASATSSDLSFDLALTLEVRQEPTGGGVDGGVDDPVEPTSSGADRPAAGGCSTVAPRPSTPSLLFLILPLLYIARR